MTIKEENRLLKEKNQRLDLLNKFLNKKIEKQSQELLDAAKDKGRIASLKKKNRILRDENNRLQVLISDFENEHINVIDFQRRKDREYKQLYEDSRVQCLEYQVKIAELQHELEQTKAHTVNLPSYTEMPQEIYDYIKALEQELEVARMNARTSSASYDLILKYAADMGFAKEVDKFLENYYQKKRGARQKISDPMINNMKRLRKGGMSIRDISATVGVSVGSVHRYIKK